MASNGSNYVPVRHNSENPRDLQKRFVEHHFDYIAKSPLSEELMMKKKGASYRGLPAGSKARPGVQQQSYTSQIIEEEADIVPLRAAGKYKEHRFEFVSMPTIPGVRRVRGLRKLHLDEADSEAGEGSQFDGAVGDTDEKKNNNNSKFEFGELADELDDTADDEKEAEGK